MVLRTVPLGHSGILTKKAGGLEPPTFGFGDRHSTNRTMLQCAVEPRGVEPRSRDFQSCAYTKSAKVPKAAAKIGGCYAVFCVMGKSFKKDKAFIKCMGVTEKCIELMAKCIEVAVKRVEVF